ncbi:MAG TPA: hypothetical protein VGB24_20345 [Longimicrobium sp.]|uniref:hypothetical protein n=1 Tax=Longimicrobium sp. TaxID=2029185 RepID=UPI002ED7FDC8
MSRTRTSLSMLAAVLALGTGACDSAPTATAEGTSASLTLNQAPVAVVNLTLLGTAYCSGTCVYNYRYDGYESYDPDGSIVAYEWKEGGSVVSTSATYNLTALRAYEACTGKPAVGTLKVTDNSGATATACYSYTAP